MVRFRKIWRESDFEHVWVRHAYRQTYMLTQRSPVEIRTPAHGSRNSNNRPLRLLWCRPTVFFHLVLIALTGGSGVFFWYYRPLKRLNTGQACVSANHSRSHFLSWLMVHLRPSYTA